MAPPHATKGGGKGASSLPSCPRASRSRLRQDAQDTEQLQRVVLLPPDSGNPEAHTSLQRAGEQPKNYQQAITLVMCASVHYVKLKWGIIILLLLGLGLEREMWYQGLRLQSLSFPDKESGWSTTKLLVCTVCGNQAMNKTDLLQEASSDR